jgi:hypothetical protein
MFTNTTETMETKPQQQLILDAQDDARYIADHITLDRVDNYLTHTDCYHFAETLAELKSKLESIVQITQR